MDNDTINTPGEECTVYDIDNVEIFRAGKWNGDEYTIDDLNEIVKAHEEIGGEIKPFLKLGHSENQALLQKDGLPSAGWIKSLSVVGDRLVASMMAVPRKIKELIDRKAYGRISSEIFWNIEVKGKKYRRALRAVALLGADTPAVTSLDDFINLYTDTDYDELKIYTEYQEVKMDNEKVQDLETKVKEYELKIKELEDREKAGADEAAKLKAYIKDQEKAAHMQSVKSLVDELIDKGKIVPAQAPFIYALCSDHESVKSYSFKEGESERKIEGKALELVKLFIENHADVPSGGASQSSEAKTYEFADDEVDAKIKEYMDKHPGIDYGAAFSIIAKEYKGGN